MPITEKEIFGSTLLRTRSLSASFDLMLLPKSPLGKIENKPAADVAAVADLINFRRSNFDDFMCDL